MDPEGAGVAEEMVVNVCTKGFDDVSVSADT
jgi:hypothetical protein